MTKEHTHMEAMSFGTIFFPIKSKLWDLYREKYQFTNIVFLSMRHPLLLLLIENVHTENLPVWQLF